MASSRSKPNSPLQSTRQMLDELDALMDRMLALPVGDAEDLPPLPREVPEAPPAREEVAGQSASAIQESGGRGQELEVRSQQSAGGGQELEVRKPEAGWAAEKVDGIPSPLAKLSVPPRSLRMDQPRPDKARPHFTLPPREEPQPATAQPQSPSPEQQSATRQEVAPWKNLPLEHSPAAPEEPAKNEPVEQPAATIGPGASSAGTDMAPPFRWGRVPLLPLLLVNEAFDFSSHLLGPIGRGLRGERGRGFLGFVGLLFLLLAGAWFIFEQISAR